MVKRNIILIILSFLVFSGVFSFRYLTKLDSVYFYKEAYSDLTSHINIWGSYDAPFGGVHMILWLYPITHLAGFVGNIFNLDWNVVVRIFFYLPSIFLSIYSIQKLADRFEIGKRGKFLMSLIYLFNTYFILLIDGGQLGVMLAYAIFPLAVESILNLNFFRTTVVLSLTAMFDPRFFAIAVVTAFLLDKLNIKMIVKFIPIFIFVLLINMYWILPIFNISGASVTTFVSSLKLTSFLNPLFLYQPHWPYNVFGKVTYPNILFVIFPLLLTIATFLKPTREKSYWLLIFIFFSFLIKGETDPLGFIYSYFVNNFNFATAFRDSTKFFTPLFVIYSLIVARYYDDSLNIDSTKNKYLYWIIPIVILIPLTSGLITGGNNNLKGISEVNNLLNLKQELKSNDFSRTIYIPQKPQLVYQTENNQAIDGRVLTNYLPFSADNYGSEDRFNFMQRDSYLNYFRSLGIKNAVYLSEKEPIKPVIVRVENSMSEKYYIDKLAVVVGSPIGAEKLVPEYGVVFLEDGKSLLSDMFKIPSNYLLFYLNDKNNIDLIMSGLKNSFIDPSLSKNMNWANYTNDDYLTWKYQLLIREIDTKDINFGNGIIMSTIKDETSSYKINVNPNTKYKIFIRAMAGKDSKGVSINDVLYKITPNNKFSWIVNDFNFIDETKELVIKNNGGFNVVGQILLIEDQKYQEYLRETNKKLKDYEVFDSKSKLPLSKISLDQKEGFLIFNQSYNAMWKMGNKSPFPINAITNGFFVEKDDFDNTIIFEEQRTLDFAAKITFASVLVFLVLYILMMKTVK